MKTLDKIRDTGRAQKGPHKLALEADASSEVVYLNKIEHLHDTPEWLHLQLSPLAMVEHKNWKYRDILDLSFTFDDDGNGDTLGQQGHNHHCPTT